MLKQIFITFIVLLDGIIVFGDVCSDAETIEILELVFENECCKFLNDTINSKFGDACLKELQLNREDVAEKNGECLTLECYLTKAKVYADGKLLVPELKKVVETELKATPIWIPLVNNAIEKCVKESTPKEAEIKKKATDPPYDFPKTRSPLLGYILSCVNVELNLQCPEPDQIKTPECNAEKALLKKCPEQYYNMLFQLETVAVS